MIYLTGFGGSPLPSATQSYPLSSKINIQTVHQLPTDYTWSISNCLSTLTSGWVGLVIIKLKANCQLKLSYKLFDASAQIILSNIIDISLSVAFFRFFIRLCFIYQQSENNKNSLECHNWRYKLNWTYNWTDKTFESSGVNIILVQINLAQEKYGVQ